MIENIRDYTARELRKLRAEKNVSLETVAIATKLDKNTISRYEKGNTAMFVDVLEKLLNYYDVAFSIFFANGYANNHCKEQEINENI